MPIIWRTGHPINEFVSDAITQGTRFPNRYTSLLTPDSIKDGAVGYGILRGTDKVFKECQRQGKPFWEIDRGYFGAQHFGGYYRISKSGMQARIRNVDLPRDRLNKLNIYLAPYQDRDGYVLLCPPSPYICEYYGIDEQEWIKEQEAKYKDTKLRYKHETGKLEDALQGASMLVTYNSTAAIEAIITGIPICMTGDDVVINEASDDATREALLRWISYCQFTLDEFRSGEAWKIVNQLQ